MNIEERFLKYVNKTDSCWLWIGSKTAINGYGQFRLNKKMILAHRISYELYRGSIPQNMFICHTCDIKNCVNPQHLWIGTHQENMQDKVEKNRQSRLSGEAIATSKLSMEEIKEIRAKYIPWKYSTTKLGKEYGVSSTQIFRIINNESWKFPKENV